MNNINKTLYIPLYGKSYVSKKGIILHDKKAEEIWAAEEFELKGKSKSKWLAYYMGMRSAVFDHWLKEKMTFQKDAVVVHIGCGMDSRISRVELDAHLWYDVDFPEVIKERRLYFDESDKYHMVAFDIRDEKWITSLPKAKKAIVVMEGVSMYLNNKELRRLLKDMNDYFDSIYVLMDCYTNKAAKASKYKNPINDVGVTTVYGVDDPKVFEDSTNMIYVKQYEMTPDILINELTGIDRIIFKKLFGGNIAKNFIDCMNLKVKNKMGGVL